MHVWLRRGRPDQPWQLESSTNDFTKSVDALVCMHVVFVSNDPKDGWAKGVCRNIPIYMAYIHAFRVGGCTSTGTCTSVDLRSSTFDD